MIARSRLQRLLRKAANRRAAGSFELGEDESTNLTHSVDGDNYNFTAASIHFVKGSDRDGIIYGYAMISKTNGVPFIDSQGDVIPETAMVRASIKFMEDTNRAVGLEHKQTEGGKVVFAFPLTDEIKKAFDIDCPVSGLLVGIKPANKETYEQFKRGELTGFSIGGAAPLNSITYQDMEVL